MTLQNTILGATGTGLGAVMQASETTLPLVYQLAVIVVPLLMGAIKDYLISRKNK